MDEWTILVGVLCGLTLWVFAKGDAAAKESEYHCYEVNERLRAKHGKPPIPWRGSMKKYLQDEQRQPLTRHGGRSRLCWCATPKCWNP